MALEGEDKAGSGKAEAGKAESMASGETVKNLENQNTLHEEGIEFLKEKLFATRNIADEAAVIAKELGMGNMEAAAFKKSFKDIATETQNISRSYDDVLSGMKESKDIQKELDKNAKNQVAIQQESYQAISSMKDASGKLLFTEQEALEASKSRDGIFALLNDRYFDLNQAQEAALGLMGEQSQQAEKNAEALAKQKKFTDGIEKSMGITGTLFKAGSKLLEKMGVDTAEVEKNIKETLANKQKELEAQGKQLTKMDGLKAITAEVAKGLLNAFKDPLVWIKMLVDAAVKFDKTTTKIQQDMGVTKTEAIAMRQEMALAANLSGDMAMNTERVAKAFSTMQKELGIAAPFSAEMALDAAVLQEKWGLTDKAIGGFMKSSLVTGKSIKEIKGEVTEITEQFKQQTGLNFKNKDIMNQVGEVSGTVRAQLGGSLEAVAGAVLEAKKFGLTLDQVANTAENLLNFEQSIEKELEAELLTGKQLNLEKARLLALTGDYEGLAKEIGTQVGTWTDYTKMNVLQQKALADSFGMSRDELSNMLMDQEAMGKTKEELIAMGKDDLAAQVESRDLQQDFNDAVQKMKQLFVDIAGGPIMVILDTLMLILEPISIALSGLEKMFSLFGDSREELTVWESILGSVAVVMGSIYAWSKMIWLKEKAIAVVEGIKFAWKVKQKGIASIQERQALSALGKGVANAATSIFQGLGKIPFGLGIPIAIAAVAAMAAGVYALSRRKGAVGGPVSGPSHAGGGVPMELEGGEFNINKSAAKSIGEGPLQQMNTTGQLPTPPAAETPAEPMVINVESETNFDISKKRDPHAINGTHQEYVTSKTLFA